MSRLLNAVALALTGFVAVGCSQAEVPPPTLYVVIPAGPMSRDPLMNFDEASQMVFANVTQTVTGDPLGVRSANGVVAHWANPDNSKWILHLREGLRFHDGRPVTAEDVVKCIQRVRSERSSPLHAFLDNLVDVRVQSGDTLEVVSSGAVNVLAQLAFIPVVPGGEPVPADGLAVGSGPYRLVSWTDHKIVLESVPGVSLNPSAPRRAEYLIIPGVEGQEEAAKALRPVVFLAPRERIVKKAAALGLEEDEIDTMASLYLICNVRPGAPLASLAARRALAATVTRHLPDPPSGRHWQRADDIVPRGVFGRVAGRFESAPDWEHEASIPKASLKLLAVDTLAPMGQELASRLRGLGWPIELVSVSTKRGVQALTRGDFDLALLGYSCTSGSALELFQFGFSAGGGAGGGANFSGYRNPRLEAILEEAATSIDPAVQHDLLAKAGDEILADLPWIPLFDVTRAYLISSGVTLPDGADRGMDLAQVRIGQ